MTRTITAISRESPLALLQTREVERLLREQGADAAFNIVALTSYGDRHKNVSLMDPRLPSDFFTRELDGALLDGTADIAVHSAKDLPYPLPAGVEVIAVTEARDKSDSLVARDGMTLATLPAGARIATSSAQRKAELLAIRQDIEVVPVRGTIEERIQKVDDGTVDALIVATCALQRLGLEQRATERLPFRTHPLQGHLAITAREDVAQETRQLFATIDIRRHWRKVVLVGFGPGDPELITVRGQKRLEEAAAIFYDDLTNEAYLGQFAGRKVYVGKRSGRHSHRQDEINELLYAAATSPLTAADGATPQPIVRLKGGDPMLFAHGREEIDYLKERLLEVEVVPGISSAVAMASLTQMPLTHRGMARSAAFLLGHTKEPLTVGADTMVYYMCGERMSLTAQALLAAGHKADTPVALVSNVSLPQQKAIYTTLGELQYAVCQARPVLLVVGATVQFAANRALQHVYYTGTQLPALHAPGDRYHHAPLIRIEATGTEQPSTEGYDWVVFTSRNGVRHYTQPVAGVRVASVGPSTTAALKARGIRVDYESPTQSAEGLIDFFRQQTPCRILLPRSAKGLKALTEGLQGHDVTDLPVYDTVTNPAAVRDDISRYEKIVFTSPTTVRAFLDLYGAEDVSQHLLVAIGPTTLAAIEEMLLR